MGGIAPVATLTPTNYTTQSGAAYPALIDGAVEVYQRLAGLFSPNSQPHPNENMTMLVNPGHVFNGATLTEVGHWTSGVFNNGGTNNQIQLVPDTAGIAVGDAAIGYVYVSGVLTLAYPTNTIVTAIAGTTVTVSNNGLISAAGQVVFCKPIGTVVTGNAHGTTTVDSMQSTEGIFIGMSVSGTGVAGGTTVASVDSATQIHTSANVTTGTGVTLTFTIPPPVSNPRIDRVCINIATGQPTWVKGTESASPSAPAIPAGFAPCCQIALKTSTTAITNTSNLSDERDVSALGAPPFTGGTLTIATAMSGVKFSEAYATSNAVASTGIINLAAVGANAIDLTAAAIGSFSSLGTIPAGTRLVLRFTNASPGATLAIGGSMSNIPGGASIALVQNDLIVVRSLGSGNWDCEEIQLASGKAVVAIHNYALLTYQLASGTGGSAIGASSWTLGTLNQNPINDNTIVVAFNGSGISGASQFVLAAGTYEITAIGQVGGTGTQDCKMRLRNTTTGPTTIMTSVDSGAPASGQGATAVMVGRFTVAANQVLELDLWTASGTANQGVAAASGELEIYKQIALIQVG